MATFAETDAQAQLYISALAAMVSKMDQNELDVTNSVPMTTAPYKLRAELLLTRRNIQKFIASEFPLLSQAEQGGLPITVNRDYKIGILPTPAKDAATLNYLRWEVETQLKTTEQRFNDHLANLSPVYYQNIPKAISV